MHLAIINDIQNFIRQIMSGITLDIMFYAGIGFEILLAIFFFIKSRYSYEMRMVRKLLKLNNWLNKNRYIDQNNLLEFNNLMKDTPKLLRYHWHQYMLYRDKNPSEFMSTYNLVEKPLKTSSYTANIKNYAGISIAISFLFLFIGLVNLGTSDVIFSYLAQSITTPFIMIFLYYILSMIMRARQNLNTAALFQYVHYFGRFLDRAVTTMPEYVDFEVLFTRSEIKHGIPVLNEYLEKRARQEQEELEKARLNAVEHESFDFSSTGVDGSLVLERAIHETETYLNIRNRLLSEIEQLESEIASSKRTFENTEKDYQKKMQASKENVDRLRKQQEETTNRIENNYIKKQQADEIKKQEQLERDHDSATMRFNQEKDSLTAEIDTRRKELENRKNYVEEVMKGEYQSFSSKMYKSIYAITEERYKEEKDELNELKEEISFELQDATFKIAEQDRVINELKKILIKNNIDINQYSLFHSDSLRNADKLSKEAAETVEEEVIETPELIPLESIPKKDRKYDKDGGFTDANGFYRYDNGAYFTPDGRYFDEKGGWYEANGEVYHPPVTEKSKKNKKQNIQEEQQQEIVQEPIQEEPQPEPRRNAADVPEKDREYGEDGGFYDKEGYYYYENGTYYTPDGRFFDENGGWYEADGVTYHAPEEAAQEEQPVSEEQVAEQPEEVNQENIEAGDKLEDLPIPTNALSEQQQQGIKDLKEQFNIDVVDHENPANKPVPRGVRLDENGAYYDEFGNYVYPNQGYYDPEGNFHDVSTNFAEVQNMSETVQEPQPEGTTQEQQTYDYAEQPAEGEVYAEEPAQETAEVQTEEIPQELEQAPVAEETQPEEVVAEPQPAAEESIAQEIPVEEQPVQDQPTTAEPATEEVPSETAEVTPEQNFENLFGAMPEEEKPAEKPAPKKRGRKPKKDKKEEGEKRKAGRPKKVEEESDGPQSIEDLFEEESSEVDYFAKKKKNKKDDSSSNELKDIDEQIAKENQKLFENQEELDKQLNETLSQLDGENN